MRLFNFLRDRKVLAPAIGLFLIVSCFIFFLVFNFGVESFKSARGIASEGEQATNPAIDHVVIESLSKALEGREAKHGGEASMEEQFLFGFLRGNYKPFRVGDKIISLKLKRGLNPVVFETESSQKHLAHNFKNAYFDKSIELADPTQNRFVASEQISYSILEKGIVAGRIDFKLSKDNELLEIKVNRL